jgi:transcriptional regulator with XRE-family HTH domain
MDEFDERVARQLGRRVRRRRHFLDLSQETVAERAGINRTQLSLYENAKRMPRAGTLVRIAAALGVSVEQLLAGVAWEVPVHPDEEDGGDPEGGPPVDDDDA